MDAPSATRIRLTLISPKGPLYRHRKGAFKKSLRYMPLTLPTLAALIPADLPVDLTCIDEGIGDVPEDLQADLIGMTVITGTAQRAYALADQFRKRGIRVVLGGPHVTLVPEDAQPHADSIVVGYAEDEWPRLLRDFAAGNMLPRYNQSPNLCLAERPLPNRKVLPRRSFLTDNVFEATRSCIHSCDFCVAPSAWGRKPLQKPVEEVVADLKRQKARQAIFVDLNLISDRDYAQSLFEALIPLKIQWYGLSTTLLCKDLPLLDLVSRSGCRGLLMGLESITSSNLKSSGKGFNKPTEYKEVVDLLHKRKISLQGCFVFGLDEDTPEIMAETARLAVDIGIDLPRFAVITPFPGTGLFHKLEAQGRILHKNWELYDGQHVVFQPARMSPETLLQGTEAAWKYVYSFPSIARRLRRTAAPWYVALMTNFGYRYYAYHLSSYYNCDWFISTRASQSSAGG